MPLRDDDDAYALVAWWAVRLMGGYEWEGLERWLEEADRATARSDDPLTRGEVLTMFACTAMRRGKPPWRGGAHARPSRSWSKATRWDGFRSRGGA